MVNINGKEWSSLEPADIQTIVAEQDFDESFYFEFKDDTISDVSMQDSLMHMVDILLSYVFSTNPNMYLLTDSRKLYTIKMEI